MKILICNDDGIKADGINSLINTFCKHHEIYVVAPMSERSAFSHSLTIHHHISVTKVDINSVKLAYAIEGTPADCVKFALIYLKLQPDLVISGVNNGTNLGTDILYSGTVAAASEAARGGCKAIALSCFGSKANFDYTSKFTFNNLEKLMLNNFYGIVNVNVPDVSNGIKGIKIVPQGIHNYSDYYQVSDKTTDNFFLMGTSLDCLEEDIDSDVKLFKRNYITITPLAVDRTDYAQLEKLSGNFK